MPLISPHNIGIYDIYLPKDCKWVIWGDFNMTERSSDKSNACGRAIKFLERFSWNIFLNTFQIQYTFLYQWGPRYSWNNGQLGKTRYLARLDRFYTSLNNWGGGVIIALASFTISIRWGLRQQSNQEVSFQKLLRDDSAQKLKLHWDSLPKDVAFFLQIKSYIQAIQTIQTI